MIRVPGLRAPLNKGHLKNGLDLVLGRRKAPGIEPPAVAAAPPPPPRPSPAPAGINRDQFVKSVPADVSVLELGPFNGPTFTGERARYFDILSTEEIRAETERLGKDASRVPEKIHYVARETPLADIPERFGAVYSSHTIEHTLDAIRHIQDVAGLLDEGGRYYLVIPDKRYCFDHYKELTSIGAVIDAYETKAADYSLKLWIDRTTKSTHSVARRHWQGDHGELDKTKLAERVGKAIEEYKGGYRYAMSPHIWCFTPESFAEIVGVLYELGYIDVRLVDLHPTRENTLEFYAVLGR